MRGRNYISQNKNKVKIKTNYTTETYIQIRM